MKKRLATINDEVPCIYFKGDIIEETNEDNKTIYDYEWDKETQQWITYDQKIHNVIFNKGTVFDKQTLHDQGYPIDKWKLDGICRQIIGLQENQDNKRLWDELDDLEYDIQPYDYIIESENGSKRIVLPYLAGNLIFHMFDQENMTGINRGFLVTEELPIIFRYSNGYYKPDGEEFLRGKLQKILKDRCKTEYKNEVIQWIKDNREIQVSRDIFNTHPEKIVLKNGVYDINENTLNEPLPDNFQTTTFPIAYNKDTECDKWLRFLDQVLYEEDIPVLQEMFGYCFYKPYKFQKAFMLVGKGANGKGVTLHTLTEMLGKKNISTAPLQRLCKERFIAYELYGKYANICGDLSSTEIKNVGMFKMLTGGDMIYAEKKHVQGGMYFRNTAKGIFSCNVVPECKDSTYSYKRRWITFEYSNRFIEGTPQHNPFLSDELEHEIPGIFNWSMKGLRRLLKNKCFSDYRGMDDVAEFMALQQDPVYQFCDTCIEEGEFIDEYGKREMYNFYLDFSKLMGFPTMAQAQFTKKFKEHAPRSVKEGQTRELGPCWHGIIYTGPKTESEAKKNKKLNVEGDAE